MAGNYDKYGNYDFSMFEPKPVSFDPCPASESVRPTPVCGL